MDSTSEQEYYDYSYSDEMDERHYPHLPQQARGMLSAKLVEVINGIDYFFSHNPTYIITDEQKMDYVKGVMSLPTDHEFIVDSKERYKPTGRSLRFDDAYDRFGFCLFALWGMANGDKDALECLYTINHPGIKEPIEDMAFKTTVRTEVLEFVSDEMDSLTRISERFGKYRDVMRERMLQSRTVGTSRPGSAGRP